MYADDTQMYITCRRGEAPIAELEECVEEIRVWMRDNIFALNDSITEVIKFSPEFGDASPKLAGAVRIDDVVVSSSTTDRDLAVILDAAGTISAHLANLCKSTSFALWKIGKIRNILSRKSAEKLIHAFVTSRLDYCNSLLFGLADHEIKKLQLIQNYAARNIARTKKFYHITPVLKTFTIYSSSRNTGYR